MLYTCTKAKQFNQDRAGYLRAAADRRHRGPGTAVGRPTTPTAGGSHRPPTSVPDPDQPTARTSPRRRAPRRPRLRRSADQSSVAFPAPSATRRQPAAPAPFSLRRGFAEVCGADRSTMAASRPNLRRQWRMPHVSIAPSTRNALRRITAKEHHAIDLEYSKRLMGLPLRAKFHPSPPKKLQAPWKRI
jgi:hypothetical protein